MRCAVRSVRRTVFLILPVVAGSPGAMGGFQECLATLYGEYADAQRTWQRSLRDMVDAGRPELSDLSRLAVEMQLALIDQAEARFRYLLDHDPDRLRTDAGLTQFVNFGATWTERDDAVLRDRNAEYRAVQERIDRLRVDTDGHPDWPALREYVGTALASTPPYAAAARRLQSAVAELESRLASCGSARDASRPGSRRNEELHGPSESRPG